MQANAVLEECLMVLPQGLRAADAHLRHQLVLRCALMNPNEAKGAATPLLLNASSVSKKCINTLSCTVPRLSGSSDNSTSSCLTTSDDTRFSLDDSIRGAYPLLYAPNGTWADEKEASDGVLACDNAAMYKVGPPRLHLMFPCVKWTQSCSFAIVSASLSSYQY